MYLPWLRGGLLLAAAFLLTVALVKPIGVSTQFIILDGVIADFFNASLVEEDETSKSGYHSSNAYLNKSSGKYAKAVAEPLNYGFIFVLSMVFGGFIGRLVTRRGEEDSAASAAKNTSPVQQMPQVFIDNFGNRPWLRYSMAFLGGALVIWGARLAGGCTSGHMMSGMMQTALSGYVFAVSAFGAAIPVSLLLYRR